ncbi:MAG: hypothetical protein KJ906_02355 [Nanoarchaeota archaeon]|nr:hypothetical protein [Nanoarchaeota archaeon]
MSTISETNLIIQSKEDAEQIESANKHSTQEYVKLLEKHGFRINEKYTAGVRAYGNFRYTAKDEEVEYGLHAWGNWGLTFYDSIGIEVPEDVRDLLKMRYGDRIQDRIPGGEMVYPYFYLEGSIDQMDIELEKFISGVGQYKHILEYGDLEYGELTSSSNILLGKIKNVFFKKKDNLYLKDDRSLRQG